METIKFRGQRLDNEEMIVGYFRPWDNKTYHYILAIGYMEYNGEDDSFKTRAIKVKPETIGQFTGLTDNNGKDIYKGDKIKWHGSLYEVIWQSYSCQWMLQSFSEGRSYATFSNRFNQEYEIVGNIHTTA